MGTRYNLYEMEKTLEYRLLIEEDNIKEHVLYSSVGIAILLVKLKLITLLRFNSIKYDAFHTLLYKPLSPR